MKSIYTQPHTSWTHRLTRIMVRPLVGTRVTPNHLTTARLLTGLASAGAFAVGDARWTFWGGVIWLVSCLLDRADGELARLGNSSSRFGHIYDYYSDITVNALMFLAIGIGLRTGWLGSAGPLLGILASAGVLLASILSERLEAAGAVETKAYVGILGFDFDDALYLFAPAAWFGLFPYILIGAAIGGPFFAILTAVRLRAARAGSEVG
ncbi:CDP-alcohol phosphatidyltransferase family protein [Inquilinus limosus]|uniref:CDP-alcohol phosphatidyltransferase family protein n=1 Tax=Inquilinus limosus TaxID=171674 RepID=UPI00040A93EB|nr:CDP-alcohol phosphatidyltransferase family protein [Inquilinus limosus]